MAPQRSSRPILCAVLDGRALGGAPETLARDLFEAGVDWIQLRDRSVASLELAQLAKGLVDARNQVLNQRRTDPTTDVNEPRVLINRRVDIALCSDADGVHLGFDALAETHARSLLPEDRLVGRSFHSVQEIESHALRPDPNLAYAHLAPIWDPLSKRASRPAVGILLLEKACAIGLPILAQGGVDPAKAEQAVAAGAAGIAVTGIITGARNPMAVTRQLREGLDRALDA
ncbi:MAG TPA: thiamine phosphate synthase [Myxococcales bacterium]|nr:thiamine phosphate synthase [Myxococcales bacterium]HIK85358.1 thiamine phosphate synthase [Myxococcales bacterium]